MEITVDLQFRAELLKKIAEREFKERTGVHCSDLIYCINKQALRRLKPLPIKDSDMLLFSIGWSTQRWLTGQAEDEPEREVDGIIVTCDALYYENPPEYGGLTLELPTLSPWELKATYQSSARPIAENIHWLRQIMAQCYVTGSTTAYLSRLEVMGNWKMRDEDYERPTLSAYKLTFSQEELDKNWAWLKDRRDQFLKVLETGELLPKAEAIPSGQAFECDRCPYRGTECE